MLKEVRPAIVLILAFTVITGLLYPAAMTGIAELIFPYQSHGSLIEKDGKVIGSALIGQEFASDKYFHGRPSATLGPDPNDPSKTTSVPYNAANSMGSNLGPTNKALIDRISADVAKLKQGNPSAQFPSTSSRLPAAGSIPTSRRKRPTSRCPVLRRHVTCRKLPSASLSMTTPRVVLSGFSAKRVLTCSSLTWPLTKPARSHR